MAATSSGGAFMPHAFCTKSGKAGARPREELEQWKTRCPVKTFCEMLIDGAVISREDCAGMTRRTDEELDEAMAFAKASPFPEAGELLRDVYRQ